MEVYAKGRTAENILKTSSFMLRGSNIEKKRYLLDEAVGKVFEFCVSTVPATQVCIDFSIIIYSAFGNIDSIYYY
jgi:hypothetical protein